MTLTNASRKSLIPSPVLQEMLQTSLVLNFTSFVIEQISKTRSFLLRSKMVSESIYEEITGSSVIDWRSVADSTHILMSADCNL